MAYTTIDDPTIYFNTVLYTGNGTTDHAITGVGFQPDFFWGKKRSASGSHFLVNSISGVGKHLHSDANLAETTFAEGVKSFDSDGVTIGTAGDINDNSQTFVAWNWLAGGSASSNSNGSTTTSVSASTTSGFSIATYTGTGSSATIGHGLSSVPQMIIVKRRDSADGWFIYHHSIGNGKYLRLETTDAEASSSNLWGGTDPTSSVFTVNNNSTNGSSRTFVAYCFAEKKGYSKFGSYTGNGNSDGTFIYTGFKPSWLMYKRTDSAHGWFMLDNKRDTFNVSYKMLRAESSSVEDTGSSPVVDFLSNGFKMRNTYNSANASGGTYIYMAFAESPFVNSNGLPTNSR